jgi:hypothetical protein
VKSVVLVTISHGEGVLYSKPLMMKMLDDEDE